MTLNFTEIYSNSWNIFKKNWWEFIVVSIIMFVLVLIPLLGGIFQFFLSLLMINAILKSIRGEKITFSSFFKIKELLNQKIITIVVAIGLYTLIVQSITSATIISILMFLGFVIIIIFFPFMCVMVDKNFNIKETILYSARLTTGIRLEIILLMVVNFLIGLIGIALLFVGIFVATPIITISIAFVYLALDSRLNNTEEKAVTINN